MVSSVDSDFYPFMEINSFFGAHEALNAMKNPWNIMAKTKTVIFAIKIEDLKKILENTPFFKHFVETESERFEEMSMVDELCGQTIQNLIDMQKRVKDMKL